MTAAAAENPDTTFILVDTRVEAANAVPYMFAEEQGMYLAGVAAALTTQTGRVGFIGGADIDRFQRYEAGFVAGVRATAPATPIDIRYLPGGDAYVDRQLGATTATSMYDLGADVIGHAGTDGLGLFDAAGAAQGRWAIGVEVDQAAVVGQPAASEILTSMVKNFDGVAYQAVADAVAGTVPEGERIFGIADGAVDLATTGGLIDGFAAELDAARDAIASGTVVVPTTMGDRRPLAPLAADCPADGCRVRIVEATRVDGELDLTIEANWFLDVASEHAHYFWSRFMANQVGADSADRFGVASGAGDLSDSFPVYRTAGAASLAAQADATEICVTAADGLHNVIDPNLFDCFPVAAAG